MQGFLCPRAYRPHFAQGACRGAAHPGQEIRLLRRSERPITPRYDEALHARALVTSARGLEAQIAALRIGFDSERDELERAISRGRLHRDVIAEDALTMGRAREADAKPPQEGDAAKSGKGERR